MRLLRSRALPFDPLAIPVLLFALGLVIVGVTQSDNFFNPFNVSNVLVQATPLLLIAIGQTFVVATGGLDLSVGAVASLAAVLVAALSESIGIAPAVAIALAGGLGVGLLNGLAVAYGLTSFLVTLGSLSIAQGIALLVLATPGGSVPDGYGELAGYFGGGVIPVALPAVTAIAVIAAVVLRRSRAGAHIVAVGGDEHVARLCGVRVGRTLVAAYVLSAAGATLAGLFLAARTRSGDPLIGARFTLDSLAAVVLGGTVLAGGRATIFGTCVAALALGLLANVLNLVGVPPFYQTPVKGLLVIGAVLLPALVGMVVLARRRRAEAAAYP